jgi:hypothetical protein
VSGHQMCLAEVFAFETLSGRDTQVRGCQSTSPGKSKSGLPQPPHLARSMREQKTTKRLNSFEMIKNSFEFKFES